MDYSSTLEYKELKAGTYLGKRYYIEEKIGQGGMGQVFRAKDLELNVIVALKVIKPELSYNLKFLKRFKRELLITRNITHKNVIRIYDFGEINNIKYISMKYIKGETLHSKIKKYGILPINRAIKYSLQICKGLNEAHLNGIIHRDLKSQNIMIDENDNAIILDFGIAISNDTDLTVSTDLIVGTPHFASPEQIKGEQIDIRSDIYSLGIVFYEIFTGFLPFEGKTPLIIINKHLYETPLPPIKKNPSLPIEINEIIIKAIEKEPDKRFNDVNEIISLLKSVDNNKTKALHTGYEKDILTRKYDEREYKTKYYKDGDEKKEKKSRLKKIVIPLLLTEFFIIIIILIFLLNKRDVKQKREENQRNQSYSQTYYETKSSDTKFESNSNYQNYNSKKTQHKEEDRFYLSKNYLSRIGRLIIKEYHPFSTYLDTFIISQDNNSYTCITTYRGMIIENKITWRIGLVKNKYDFKIIHDTSIFSKKNIENFNNSIKAILKKFIRD